MLNKSSLKGFCAASSFAILYRPHTFETNLDVFLAHGGRLIPSVDFDDGTLLVSVVQSKIGFGSVEVSRYLFGHSESWMIEDLKPIDAWIIGLLAYTDQKFRTRLEAYLSLFRSAFVPQTNILNEEPLPDAFDIDIIVKQVMSASVEDRVSFIQAICTSGTRVTLEPFINAGIDVNETGRVLRSYLETAVRTKNSEIFKLLLFRGAAARLAIRYLYRYIFDFSSEELRDYLSPIMDQISRRDFTDHLDDLDCAISEILHFHQAH